MFRRTFLVLLLVTAGACSSKGEHRAGGTKTTAAAAPTLAFTVTGIEDNGTKRPDDAIVAAVKRVLDRWLADAVVGPLHSGKPAGDLSAIFTTSALDRMTDPSVRATFVDEGLPPATTSITAERADAFLASVAGPDEVVGLMAARIDVKARAVGPAVDVDIVHQGEVVLAPDGGGWKIESFAVRASRDSREATP